ncbi:hypothetical protein [Hyphomicrobium sp.]|uniref:hypothetical protein n=1 Tax=Hyphomicrobium sp. TaxID=82 RepID=UPI002FDD5028
MTTKPRPPTKEDRLAKALRENLARRKALVRAKKARAKTPAAGDTTSGPDDDRGSERCRRD